VGQDSNPVIRIHSAAWRPQPKFAILLFLVLLLIIPFIILILIQLLLVRALPWILSSASCRPQPKFVILSDPAGSSLLCASVAT
jgi:hypothetical protein